MSQAHTRPTHQQDGYTFSQRELTQLLLVRGTFVRAYNNLLDERRTLVGAVDQCVGAPLGQQTEERGTARNVVSLWQLLAKVQTNLQQEHLTGACSEGCLWRDSRCILIQSSSLKRQCLRFIHAVR